MFDEASVTGHLEFGETNVAAPDEVNFRNAVVTKERNEKGRSETGSFSDSVTSYTSKEIVWGARFCHKSVLDRVGMMNIASTHTFTIPYNPEYYNLDYETAFHFPDQITPLKEKQKIKQKVMSI